MVTDDLVRDIRRLALSGSVPAMRGAAARWWKAKAMEPDACAKAVMAAWNQAQQPEDRDVRMAVCLLAGPVSAWAPTVLELLVESCSTDPDWRVQEMLAKALAWRCDEIGWAESVEDLRTWLAHPRANVRRAAAEGPRVWTRREYFVDHPRLVLDLLAPLRSDPSRYARDSCAHAVSDVSRTEPDLVLEALARWTAEDPIVGAWMSLHAGRQLVTSHPDAMRALTQGE